uniref:Uncharacterized protein n=1 Tax=Ixodes ricinus TaxID=34613 RepID=A0A6B0UPJ4_IXORI
MNKSGISLFLPGLAAFFGSFSFAFRPSPRPFRFVLRWRRESASFSRSNDDITERFCWHSPAEADRRFWQVKHCIKRCSISFSTIFFFFVLENGEFGSYVFPGNTFFSRGFFKTYQRGSTVLC